MVRLEALKISNSGKWNFFQGAFILSWEPNTGHILIAVKKCTYFLRAYLRNFKITHGLEICWVLLIKTCIDEENNG